MGLFTKTSSDLCYFCNNDYFKLFKTIDNNFVCKDCLGSNNLTEDDILFMSLEEVIKAREAFSLGESEACGSERIRAIDKGILLTASNDLPGYEIEKHLDLVCVESLISLGYNMNYENQGLLGRPSGDKDMKFKEAKNAALMKLKIAASDLGGNALIGVTLSSSVFYDKRSVVATGTVVQMKKTNL